MPWSETWFITNKMTISEVPRNLWGSWLHNIMEVQTVVGQIHKTKCWLRGAKHRDVDPSSSWGSLGCRMEDAWKGKSAAHFFPKCPGQGLSEVCSALYEPLVQPRTDNYIFLCSGCGLGEGACHVFLSTFWERVVFSLQFGPQCRDVSVLL